MYIFIHGSVPWDHFARDWTCFACFAYLRKGGRACSSYSLASILENGIFNARKQARTIVVFSTYGPRRWLRGGARKSSRNSHNLFFSFPFLSLEPYIRLDWDLRNQEETSTISSIHVSINIRSSYSCKQRLRDQRIFQCYEGVLGIPTNDVGLARYDRSQHTQGFCSPSRA